MVNLTRIYTRTGDDGTTALGDFSRTSKNDPRLVAYADVDEANSAIGVALALRATASCDEACARCCTRVQNDLFDVGADLCTPRDRHPGVPAAADRRGTTSTDLEAACDALQRRPDAAALVHPARRHAGRRPAARGPTVVRRAERAAWAALDATARARGRHEPADGQYLNRLSRPAVHPVPGCANGADGDVLWVPGGGRRGPTCGGQAMLTFWPGGADSIQVARPV